MNTQVYLEHANIAVSNISSAVDFFKAAFPDFRIRGGGPGWVHFGNDDTYVALNTATHGKKDNKDHGAVGVSHIGFVVSDVEGVADRLLAAGFERSYPKTLHQYRVRDYFVDKDYNEYEFVQYLTEEPLERNSYDD